MSPARIKATVRHLVAWISRVDAVIAGPLGLMRCGRSWASQLQHAVQDVDSNCHLGCLTLVGLRAQRVTDYPFPAADRLPPRHASCTPTLSANPSGQVRQSRSDAGHAVWAPSRPSGSAPHSTAVAR